MTRAVLVGLVIVAALEGGYLWAGKPGLIGMACGLVATTFNLVALSKMVSLASHHMAGAAPPVRRVYSRDDIEDSWSLPEAAEQPVDPAKIRSATRRGTVLIVTTFFIKLPVFAAFALVAQRAGEGALGAFAAGILLVYFGLVGWALGKKSGPV